MRGPRPEPEPRREPERPGAGPPEGGSQFSSEGIAGRWGCRRGPARCGGLIPPTSSGRTPRRAGSGTSLPAAPRAATAEASLQQRGQPAGVGWGGGRWLGVHAVRVLDRDYLGASIVVLRRSRLSRGVLANGTAGWVVAAVGCVGCGWLAGGVARGWRLAGGWRVAGWRLAGGWRVAADHMPVVLRLGHAERGRELRAAANACDRAGRRDPGPPRLMTAARARLFARAE